MNRRERHLFVLTYSVSLYKKKLRQTQLFIYQGIGDYLTVTLTAAAVPAFTI